MATLMQNMWTSLGPVYTAHDSDNDVTGYGIDSKVDTQGNEGIYTGIRYLSCSLAFTAVLTPATAILFGQKMGHMFMRVYADYECKEVRLFDYDEIQNMSTSELYADTNQIWQCKETLRAGRYEIRDLQTPSSSR